MGILCLALLGLSTALVCPDGGMCEDRDTCCKNTMGGYGCCPLPHAECCSDHLHCCFEGTVCDLVHSKCVNKTLGDKVKAVICPDQASECPDETTCCQLLDGSWGCCPLVKAVCCEDKLHCCPEGTKCDIAHSRCVSASLQSFPMLEKLPARRRDNNTVSLVTCPGGKSSCPDSSTCCLLTSGDYGCCPYPDAVCCSDHIHCCPEGTKCDLLHSACVSALGESSAAVRIPAAVTELNSKCDKSTSCPGKSTCCKTASGDWACCPLPQAVCCNDHEHCCPKGYKCNVTEQTCDRPGGLSLPWLRKVPALQTESSLAVSGPTRPARNMCDATTSCPKDTTCCFMDRTHKWGCCPLPKAVCCNDGNHCCPSGHTCEPHRSSCSKGPHVIPWFAKLSAQSEPGDVTDVKCDDKSSCASGTTCCKLQTGEWGCCPLVKAVCCADHEHCCPQGYTCNMQTGTCEKKSHEALVGTVPLSRVVRPEPGGAEGDEDVPCDSAGEFHCPERDTCCKLSATEWACCPSPRAVCCSDSKHCCPAGYSCDLQAGGCTPQTPLTWDSLLGDRKKDFVQRGFI
uniref:Granulins n=1 Tax=Dicentrarchus labrax TaxID=13489 RepID=E6ZI53_DICLA|nr:Granulins [Dicentrarchus labrax]